MRVIVDPLLRPWDSDLCEQVDRPSPGLTLPQLVVLVELLLDLPADVVDRVQRGHRVLEDHRDLFAANLAHRVTGEAHQVAALVDDLALVDDVRVGDQPHHRHHRHALAGAGLADDPDHLALADRERDPVDGAHKSVLGAKGNLEILDREQRLGHYAGLTRGSSQA